MTTYVIGADNIDGKEQSYIDAIKSVLEGKGHTVESLGVGPGNVQSYGLKSSAQGKQAIFVVGGSDIGTYADMSNSYYHYDYIWFAFASWTATTWITCDALASTPLVRAHDDNFSSNSAIASYIGKTAKQFFDDHKDKMYYVCGDSAEVLGQRILSGGGGSGGSSSSSSGGTSTTAPLLEGKWSFQELISEICNGIDIMFLVKRNMVLITDYENLFSDAIFIREGKNTAAPEEDIKQWQLEEGSYDMNINKYGYYNSVTVNYSGGSVTETYDDLVNIYGEINIIYDEPKATKAEAQAKAKSLLSAHLRDFSMSITATTTVPDIDIGDIITLKNPLNKTNKSGSNEEMFFTKGVNIQWDGDTLITNDMELLFGPEPPDRPEVPITGSTGTGSSTGSFNNDFVKSGCGDGSVTWDEFCHVAQTFIYSAAGTNHDPEKAWSMYGMKEGSGGDCYDFTAWAYYVGNFKVGVATLDICTSGSGQSGTHHFPAFKTKDGNFKVADEFRQVTTNLKPTDSREMQITRDAPTNGQIAPYVCCKYGQC